MRPFRVALLVPALAAMTACVDSPNTAAPTTTTTTVPAACAPGEPAVQRDVVYRDLEATPVDDPALVSFDVYRPELPEGCAAPPVVVWVHGGGFSLGDKANNMDDKVDLFTGAGYALVSVNYRLAPDPLRPGVQHPTQVEDIAAAIGYLSAHAEELGLDADRLAVLGHSAGAFLAALAGTDPTYLDGAGIPFDALRCVAALDFEYYDIPAGIEDPRTERMFRNAFGDDPALWAAASPQRLVQEAEPGTTFPAFLLVTRGSGDRKGATQAFADALRAAGGSPVVVDAAPLHHAGVNDAVGQPGDTIVTPPLMSFLDGCRPASTGQAAEAAFTSAAKLDKGHVAEDPDSEITAVEITTVIPGNAAARGDPPTWPDSGQPPRLVGWLPWPIV